MNEKLHLNVSLSIHDGRLGAFQAIAREMVEATRKESGTLSYELYVSNDGMRCQLIESYADADALLAHFDGPAVKEGVPKMLETAQVSGFEVYGDPGPRATDVLSDFGDGDIFVLARVEAVSVRGGDPSTAVVDRFAVDNPRSG